MQFGDALAGVDVVPLPVGVFPLVARRARLGREVDRLAAAIDRLDGLAPLEDRDVVQRVAVDDRDVGKGAFAEAADIVPFAQQSRIAARRRLERLAGREAEIGPPSIRAPSRATPRRG